MEEQERLYLLLQRLYCTAAEYPSLFVTELHEDDAYPNRFNKRSYGKLQLETNMKNAQGS